MVMRKLLFAVMATVSLAAISCKSSKTAQTTTKTAQEQKADADNIVSTLKKTVPGIDITEMGDRVKIVLGEATYFSTGSAVLSQGALTSLDQMATVLQKYNQTKIDLNGYTDNTGTAAINKKLSADRAVSVKNYLVSKGVGAARIATFGRAAARPVASNSTAEGRAKNRRVEFIIFYK